jgi:hypothetical protein
MIVPTPKDMREVVEIMAASRDCDAEMCHILHFMIGYYKIDYPNEGDSQ